MRIASHQQREPQSTRRPPGLQLAVLLCQVSRAPLHLCQLSHVLPAPSQLQQQRLQQWQVRGGLSKGR